MKLLKSIFCFITLVLITLECRASNILVLSPVGPRSHLYSLMPIAETLARRGHQVTLVTTHRPETKSPNIRKIVLDDLVQLVEADWQSFERQHPLTLGLNLLVEFRTLSVAGYSSLMANEEFREIIDTQTVDLVVVDTILNDITLPFIDHMKVPFIFYSPASSTPWTLAALGVDQEFASVPSAAADFNSQMAFFERLANVVMVQVFLFIRKHFLLSLVDNLAKKDFPDVRPAHEIERDAVLCLVNIHLTTDWPRALPPTIIPVGAMHVRPAKPLPKV